MFCKFRLTATTVEMDGNIVPSIIVLNVLHIESLKEIKTEDDKMNNHTLVKMTSGESHYIEEELNIVKESIQASIDMFKSSRFI